MIHPIGRGRVLKRRTPPGKAYLQLRSKLDKTLPLRLDHGPIPPAFFDPVFEKRFDALSNPSVLFGIAGDDHESRDRSFGPAPGKGLHGGLSVDVLPEMRDQKDAVLLNVKFRGEARRRTGLDFSVPRSKCEAASALQRR